MELCNVSYTRLNDIWGSAADDVYAVGRGTLLHFDGDRWSRQVPPTRHDPLGIHGTAGDDVYAVDGRSLFHFDGIEWREDEDAPDIRPYDVWRAPDGGLFLAGDVGVAVRRHKRWKTFTAVGGLRTVWGVQSDEAFAAGQNTLLRYDGAVWRIVKHSMDGVTKLWGLRWGVVYACAGDGMYRRSGEDWLRVEGNPALDIVDVWGSAEENLYLVTSTGRVYHFDGYRDRLFFLHEDFRISAMWGDSPSDVFAVGPSGELLRFVPEERLP